MNEEKLNISIRKFLKNVGITSQRKIEEKIRENIPNSSKKIKISVNLESDELDLNEKIEGEIDIPDAQYSWMGISDTDGNPMKGIEYFFESGNVSGGCF